MSGVDYRDTLLTNPHEELSTPSGCDSSVTLVRGNYSFYHYGCDGFDDRVCFYAIYTDSYLYNKITKLA